MSKLGLQLCSISVLMAVGSLSNVALADGLLMSSQAVAHPQRTTVRVEVLEEVATTSTELEFAAIAGTDQRFLFPVPESASVVGFSVFRNGAWEKAEMTANNSTTPGQVSGSPGGGLMTPDLKAYLGGNSFIISVTPDSDTEPMRVKLETIQILPYEFGEVSYLYPLADYPLSSGGARESFSLTMTVSSVRPISGYQATGYASMASVQDQSPGHLVVSYQANGFTPSSDFPFSYAVTQNEKLYVNLLTSHEKCGEDGFYLLIVEPKQEIDESEVIPKYFSFVMDTSGSMAGYKVEQAKDAARYFVQNLNTQDRFNVISFNSVVDPLFPSPQTLSTTTQSQAIGFIDAKYADSMTDLNAALLTALNTDFDTKFARILVLLTDGQPTAGETNPTTILQNVKNANTSKTRIFTFGIGTDVNKSLLTSLATGNNGQAQFLAANDQISQVLSGFYKKIDRPVLTDVTIDYGGIKVYDNYPNEPTDLFAGTALLVLGRYKAGGDVQGTLTGSMFGTPESYTFPMSFPECAADQNGFLPRLWAKSKIDALIEKMEEQGYEDEATIALIKELGTKYGIQTPYSSYEMGEDPGAGGSGAGGGSGYGGKSGYGGSNSGTGNGYGANTGSDHSYSGGGLEIGGCQMGSGSPASSISFGLISIGLLLGLRRRRQH